MIFILNSFSMKSFGLATAVRQFASVLDAPRVLARQVDPSLVARSSLRPIRLWAAIFGRERCWHIDDLFAPICLSFAVFGLMTGRQVIICPHGMLDRWALRQGRTAAKLRALRLLNLLARVGRLYIHALNRAEARKAGLLLSNARRIDLIPNGVPSDILARREDISHATSLARPFIIGCLSRIAPKKNQVAMVELAARLRRDRPALFESATFRIDGHVEDKSYAAQIAARIDALGLTDKVYMGGDVAFDDRADCLARYDVFFFPSKSEGMPYVVLEAMALGAVPLVANTASCDFVVEFGGKVYYGLDDAVAWLPETPRGLDQRGLDDPRFLEKFGTDRLRAYLRDFEETAV